MARKSSPRDNYRQDAIVLNRMIGAIELDDNATDEWKRTIMEHLTRAMKMLLERESERRLQGGGFRRAV